MKIRGPKKVNKMLANGDFQGLIASLKNKNANYRIAAATALGKLGKPEALEHLIRTMVNELDVKVKEAIANSLGLLFTGAALKPLVHLLVDSNDRVRQIAGKLLSQVDYLKTDEAFRHLLDSSDEDILINAIGDPYADVRNCAAKILQVLGDRVVPKLVTALSSPSSTCQINAVIVLGWIKSPSAIDGLLAKSGERNLKYKIREALVQIGRPTVPKLMATFKKKNASRKQMACHALGELKVAEAVPQLIEALDDSDKDLRAAACSALGMLKWSEAIPSLINAMGDDYTVSSSAQRALSAMDEKPLADAIKKALDGDASGLIALKDNRANHILIQRMGSGNSRHRKAACKAMGQLGENKLTDAFQNALDGDPEPITSLNDERAIPLLLNVLIEDNNKKIKESAAKTLGHWGGKAYNGLVPLLDYTKIIGSRSDSSGTKPIYDTWVKCAAIMGISNSDKVSAYDLLLPFINDQDANVGAATVEALVSLNPERAVEVLVELLKDDNCSFRIAAAIALGKSSVSHLFEALHTTIKDNEWEGALQFLATDQIMQFFLDSKNPDFRFVALEVLSKREDVLPIIKKMGEKQQVVDVLLARFADAKWDRSSAVCLMKLVPETTLDSNLFSLTIEAMGFSHTRPDKHKRIVSTIDGDRAIESLCAIKTPIISNILHMVSRKPSVKTYECRDCVTGVEVTLDFASQKQQAIQELELRDNPSYDVRYFMPDQQSN